MASHFSSIGFPIRSQEELQSLSERLLPHCEEHRTKFGKYLRHESPCGAELWFQVAERDALIGVTPYFAAETRLTVRLTEAVTRAGDTPLDGALHGWAGASSADVESDGHFPFAFDCPDFRSYGEIAYPTIAEVSLGAFAHTLSSFASVADYEASQAGEETRFASQSFIPSGLFSPDGSTGPAQSEAVLTGHVRATELRTNPATGAQFVAAQVESFGGIFHVVADPALLPTPPVVGGVLSGSFWLCGRLVNPPPTKPAKSMLRRLLGR